MDASFYKRWVIANAWSEGVGLSATLGLGLLVAPQLERDPGPFALALTALLAIALGTALEGALVGFAQGRVLERAAAIPLRRWVRATMLGAGIAWVLGMLPSTIIGMAQSPEPGAPMSEPSAPVQYALAAFMGLVLGVVLGLPQMFVLRGSAARPKLWLLANALAWALGMPLVFVGMDQVPWGGPPGFTAFGVLVTCLVTGSVVGAVHGAFLQKMLLRPR